jgi:hypothetical protein
MRHQMATGTNWLSRIFLLLGALLVFDVLSGLYLYAVADFSVLYQYTLLFHIGLGFLLFVPLILYLFKHFVETSNVRHPWGKTWGYISFFAVAIISLSGVYLTWVGQRKGQYWISDVHTWSGFIGVLILAAHVFIRLPRRDRAGAVVAGAETLRFRTRLTSRRALGAVMGICALLVAIPLLYTAGYREVPYADGTPASYSLSLGRNPFTPSESMTASGAIIDAKRLGNSQSCARSGCHQDIYRQ